VNYSAQTRAVTAIASSSKGDAEYPTVRHSKRYLRRKGRMPPSLSYGAMCANSCTMSERSRQQSDRIKIPWPKVNPRVAGVRKSIASQAAFNWAETVAGSFRLVTGEPDPGFEHQSRTRRRFPFRKATHRRAKSFALSRLPRQQPVATACQIVRGAILGSSMKNARQNDNPSVSKSRSQAESVSGKSTRRSVNITNVF
jgi:hypothetical protein